MDSKKVPSSTFQSPFFNTRFRHWIGGILIEMKRKSPVQQWIESAPQQENKPIEKSSSHEDDDISISEEACDIASLKIDSDSESINAGASTSAVASSTSATCSRSDNDTKEDTCSQSVEKLDSSKSINENANISAIESDSKDVSLYKGENGSVTHSDSVLTPQSEESERKDKVYSYSVSVDSGNLLERNKAPLLRDRSVNSEGDSPKRYPLRRDSSLQLEPSRASSVESLLEARKVDAEAVLRGVGFGPSPSKQQLARIPDRFLRPSQVKGVDTDQFIRDEQESMKKHECGVFGYRGLTGDPHSPTSTIVAKIIERISSREEMPEILPSPRSRRNTNTY